MFYQILFSPHMKGSVIISHKHGVYESPNSGGDYVIPICRGEILTRTTWPDFTLRLHPEIKPRPPPPLPQGGAAHHPAFVCIFFELFFVSMSVYEI